MGHIKIQLVPQGVLARDVGMSVNLTRSPPTVVEPTETATPVDCPPLLVIETQSPVVAAEFSYVVVYLHDTRTTDLTVTLTTSDEGKIAWVTGSPPHASSDPETVVTIPAGRSDVVVPIRGGDVGTDIIISGVADGYPDASVTVDVVHDLIYPIDDVIISYSPSGGDTILNTGLAGYPAGKGIINWGQTTFEFGTPTIAEPLLTDANSSTLSVVATYGLPDLLFSCRVRLTDQVKAIDPSRIGWTFTCSDPGVIVYGLDDGRPPTFGSTIVAGASVYFKLLGFVYYFFSYGPPNYGSVPLAAGLVFTITSTLDGVPIDSTRSTFTLTLT